jgi:hypothetical protein
MRPRMAPPCPEPTRVFDIFKCSAAEQRPERSSSTSISIGATDTRTRERSIRFGADQGSRFCRTVERCGVVEHMSSPIGVDIARFDPLILTPFSVYKAGYPAIKCLHRKRSHYTTRLGITPVTNLFYC